MIEKIRTIYQSGGNLLDFLRFGTSKANDTESIMISYDFQAGGYIKLAENNKDYFDKYTDSIRNELLSLHSFQSIMEVGVGEATLMSPLMHKLDPDNRLLKFGFDISWSRIRYGIQYAEKFKQEINFFTANLFYIPLPDSSIDIVYTSHSLEPNGGREKDALKELYRIARKYVVLLEPDYEGGSPEARERMAKNGYVKNLASNAREMGYQVISDRSFEVFINPLNPTRLTIIKKEQNSATNPSFCCPVTNTTLANINGCWYSKETGLLYPIIDGIPCFLEQNAILATHYHQFNF